MEKKEERMKDKKRKDVERREWHNKMIKEGREGRGGKERTER